MSFSVKVDVQRREAGQADFNHAPATSSLSRTASAADAADLAGDAVAFSAGNPRVEYLTGVVHLYRDVPPADAAQRPAWSKPEDRGNMLAVLAVSPDMGVADFCTWAGGYLPSIRDMRFVRRDDARASCLVLLRFDSAATAVTFHKERDNKPFWTLEPDVICRLVFVRDVQYDEGGRGSSGATAAAATDGSPGASSSSVAAGGGSETGSRAAASSSAQLPAPGHTELPTCPVCLERLDAHISGIVTTVCNHRFHNECLMRWADTSCPVCRYCLDSDGHVSHCATCNTAADLWICLICGHVGCGRYRSGHANNHWQETSHCYALELETQRVWDYASDGYVHRLIQSKTDGKLVEVPSPAPAQRDDGGGGGGATSSNTETRYDADMEEALMSSKLDAIGQEYNALLANQLDEQRRWFEGRHAKAMSELESQCAELSAVATQYHEAAKAAAASAAAVTQQRKAVEAKLAKEVQRTRDLSKERDVLDALNAQMRANQKALKERHAAEAAAAAAKLAERDAEVLELKEQVRDLMMFIEGQRQVAEAAAEDGLAEASISLPPTPQQPTSPPSTSKRRVGRNR